jgi:hypothetical protein
LEEMVATRRERRSTLVGRADRGGRGLLAVADSVALISDRTDVERERTRWGALGLVLRVETPRVGVKATTRKAGFPADMRAIV